MDLLLPGLGLMVWNSLFFLLTFAILAKFAWKPILSMLDARDNEITESLEQAKQARAELTGVKVESQNILKEARRERDAIIKNAKEERERMIEAARADASREAAAIIKDANSQIEREKQQVKKDIAGISVAIASKVLGDELKDSARQQKTLEDSIKDMNL